MKYVAFIRNGMPCVASYDPKRIAAVCDDMLRDDRISVYKTGFGTMENALQWAKENM